MFGTAKKLAIDLETQEAWERTYAAAIGNAPTDDDELERIEREIERTREGAIWLEDGSESYVGGRAEWTVDAVRAGMNEGAPDLDMATAKRNAILFIGGLAAVTFLILGVLFVPLFFPASSSKTGTPTATARFADGNNGNGAGANETPRPTPILPVIVAADNSNLPLDAPRSVEIGGQAYQVIAGSVSESGRIILPANIDDLATLSVWLPSPANWLLGMREDRVLAFQIGDRITARTLTGSVLVFTVDATRDVQPQEIEALAQNRAGLTVIPLPARTAPVRVVSARYEPDLSEQADTPAADALLATPVVGESGGQFLVSSVGVNQLSGGQYAVTVSGEAATVLPTPRLDVGGQLFPAPTGLGPGVFTVTFPVATLGVAEFLLDGKRIALGELSPPRLSAQITAANMNGATLALTLQVTAAGGAAAVRSGDFALLLTTPEGAVEIAPLSFSPADLTVTPGQSATVIATFAFTGGAARVRLFDQLWEIAQ